MGLPIGVLLFGGGIPIPHLFDQDTALGTTPPETLQYARISRGNVVNTAGGAHVEDWGEGIGQLSVYGHTGWKAGGIPGEVRFKALEALFVEYEDRRDRLARAGADPDVVQLWWLDAMNLEALSIYPHEFVLERSRTRPLLQFYRIRASVLVDLLKEAIYSIPTSGGLPDITAGLGTLMAAF